MKSANEAVLLLFFLLKKEGKKKKKKKGNKGTGDDVAAKPHRFWSIIRRFPKPFNLVSKPFDLCDAQESSDDLRPTTRLDLLIDMESDVVDQLRQFPIKTIQA